MSILILDVAEFPNKFQEMSSLSLRVSKTDFLWTEAGGRLQAEASKTKFWRFFYTNGYQRSYFTQTIPSTAIGMPGIVTTTECTEVHVGLHHVKGHSTTWS